MLILCAIFRTQGGIDRVKRNDVNLWKPGTVDFGFCLVHQAHQGLPDHKFVSVWRKGSGPPMTSARPGCCQDDPVGSAWSSTDSVVAMNDGSSSPAHGCRSTDAVVCASGISASIHRPTPKQQWFVAAYQKQQDVPVLLPRCRELWRADPRFLLYTTYVPFVRLILADLPDASPNKLSSSAPVRALGWTQRVPLILTLVISRYHIHGGCTCSLCKPPRRLTRLACDVGGYGH